ncbi:unnamed protein product [Cladocopium goreaui]|uniref:ABC transmembrane type-1 domain-containing protein n=1 Tax=Cladocopium goreaui TaxID=2562237 RepID=A0A9P1G0T0_9DINO|nr:unnamed protein product [Cladocopium goreaui]
MMLSIPKASLIILIHSRWLASISAPLIALLLFLTVLTKTLIGVKAIENPESSRDVREHVCAREYREKEELWTSMSGATTVYIPMDHQPDWYWEEVMRRRGIQLTSKPVSGYEDLWLDQLLGEAQMQVLGCGVHSGRYWEMSVDIRKLFRLMVKGSTFTLLRLLSRHIANTEDHLETPEDLPDIMRLSVCTPFSCDEDLVINRIFADHFAHKLMGPNAARKLGNFSFQDVLQVNELEDWSSINIDFVIGGTDSCGTSSLHKNLEQHPELAFSSTGEDFFFTADLAHRLLPLKSQVETYNAQLEHMKDGKWNSSGVRPWLIGICNPTIFAFGLARRKLAAMLKVKMIMILCDPVGRAEKLFMEYHYCFDDFADAKHRRLAAGRDETKPCFQSAKSLLSERFGKLKSFWQNRAVALHMPAMMHLFSGRLLFVHQEQLREDSERVFNSLTQFLGVKYPFRDDTRFHRYNSIGGNRTDLCYNHTLVRALQKYLEPEYQMQETILTQARESIPETLRKRVTRCDRPEAEFTYCPSRTACADEQRDLK